MLFHPGHYPLCRIFLGQGAGTGVVRHHLTRTACAERGEHLVETDSALAESVFVCSVTECDDVVGDVAEVRLLGFQAAEQRLRVVRHIAVSVGRGANEEGSAVLEDAGLQPVHDLNAGLMAGALERRLNFLRHHFRGPGHGADQDRDIYRHVVFPQRAGFGTSSLLSLALLYVPLRKYNASTVGRKRDIMHVEEAEQPEVIAAPETGEQTSAAESEYLKVLGERVRETRARRGMTRKILARDSGVSERYLAQLETGQGNISILLLRDISRALDLPLEALVLEGTDPPIDLVHATALLRGLRPEQLLQARQLLVERFGGADQE